MESITNLIEEAMDAFLKYVNHSTTDEDERYELDEFKVTVQHTYTYRLFWRDYIQLTLLVDPADEGGPSLVQTTFSRLDDASWKMDYGVFCFDTYWTEFFKDGQIVHPK